MRSYVVRLIGYALLLGACARIAQAMWAARGLDAVDVLQPFHDRGLTVLLLAPVVLALIGFGRARPLAALAGGALAGAALTAPYVCAAAVAQ